MEEEVLTAAVRGREGGTGSGQQPVVAPLPALPSPAPRPALPSLEVTGQQGELEPGWSTAGQWTDLLDSAAPHCGLEAGLSLAAVRRARTVRRDSVSNSRYKHHIFQLA